MNKINSFINDFKKLFPHEMEITFYYGYCYWFAFILSERFKGEIWFNPLLIHFACMIDNVLYDIFGEMKFTEKNKRKDWISWEDYQYKYQESVQSIVNSCIKKIKE